MEEIYALLWSKKANCLHIEPLLSTQKSGMRFLTRDMANDYLLIFSGAYTACNAKADELRPILNEREEVRRLYGAE